MRFLLDQDVYSATARFLSDLGHDVVPVAKIGYSNLNQTSRVSHENRLKRLSLIDGVPRE